jgi:hypothetical protein
VAMLCSQCGKTIEKDEARFCNHCGVPVQRQSSVAQPSEQENQPASSSHQPVSSSAQEDKPVHKQVVEQQHQRPPLREQIAEQPGAKRQPSVRVQAPQQMGEERTGEEHPALKEQMAHIRPPSHPVPPAAPTKPEMSPGTGEQSTDYDLQAVHSVKSDPVEWLADLPSTPPLAGQQDSEEEEPVEEMPTRLIASPPATEQKENKQEEEPVEERPTQCHVEALPPAEQKENKEEQKPVEERTTQLMAREVLKNAPAEHVEDMPTVPFAYDKAKTRTSRKPLAIVLAALVLVGVGIWIIVAQPFSVSSITQPQVGFNDNTLHISLLYPNGWMYKVSTSQSTVLFHDSTNTAQMTIITASAADGSDLSTYLQAQADRVGIATPKTISPASFAGATWQGVQGTVQQKGANYTCTVFATVQGNRLITIIQQAPQSTYNQEDNLVFSQMRSSLKLS